MYYEINVSLNGHHLFATAERSILSTWQLHKIMMIFEEKFPKEDGYDIIIQKWEKIGSIIKEY